MMILYHLILYQYWEAGAVGAGKSVKGAGDGKTPFKRLSGAWRWAFFRESR